MRKVNRDGFSSEYKKRHSRGKKKNNSSGFGFDFRSLLLRFILIGNLCLLGLTVWFSLFLPSLNDLENLMGKESTVFFDVDGEVIYR